MVNGVLRFLRDATKDPQGRERGSQLDKAAALPSKVLISTTTQPPSGLHTELSLKCHTKLIICRIGKFMRSAVLYILGRNTSYYSSFGGEFDITTEVYVWHLASLRFHI